ncbi:MAG: CRISPR-associated RAMP protein [Chloroflexi bacterium]|nr:CRISPR-associated RAMP protein [Chloroflexota bacterium]
MSDFSRFSSRVYLEGQLHLRTPLRIGTGKVADVTGPDMPVIKDALGNPVIPGASLKGAMRSYVEAILRTLQTRDDVQNSDFRLITWPREVTQAADLGELLHGQERTLVTEPMSELSNEPPPPDTLSVRLLQTWKEHWSNAELSQASLDTAIINASSLIQTVFGAPWVASKVYLRDAAVVDEGRRIRTVVRDGVAIHRDRRTAQDKALYQFEAVPAGTRFHFSMVIENGTPAEIGVALLAVNGLRRADIPLGGGVSRGLGKVELVDLKAQLVGEQNLVDYLVAGSDALVQLEEADFQDYFAEFLNTIGIRRD